MVAVVGEMNIKKLLFVFTVLFLFKTYSINAILNLSSGLSQISSILSSGKQVVSKVSSYLSENLVNSKVSINGVMEKGTTIINGVMTTGKDVLTKTRAVGEGIGSIITKTYQKGVNIYKRSKLQKCAMLKKSSTPMSALELFSCKPLKPIITEDIASIYIYDAVLFYILSKIITIDRDVFSIAIKGSQNLTFGEKEILCKDVTNIPEEMQFEYLEKILQMVFTSAQRTHFFLFSLRIRSLGEMYKSRFPYVRYMHIENCELFDVFECLLNAFPNLENLVIKKSFIEMQQIQKNIQMHALSSLLLVNIYASHKSLFFLQFIDIFLRRLEAPNISSIILMRSHITDFHPLSILSKGPLKELILIEEHNLKKIMFSASNSQNNPYSNLKTFMCIDTKAEIINTDTSTDTNTNEKDVYQAPISAFQNPLENEIIIASHRDKEKVDICYEKMLQIQSNPSKNRKNSNISASTETLPITPPITSTEPLNNPPTSSNSTPNTEELPISSDDVFFSTLE